MPRTAIIGIGNLMKADDGAGMITAALLKERMPDSPELRTFETGSTPENHLAEIVAFKPDIIYLVDAADFNAGSGDVQLFPAGRVGDQGFSTHAISVSLVIKFLQEQTGARIYLLAIQPEDLSTREGLSAPVKAGTDRAAAFLEGECRGRSPARKAGPAKKKAGRRRSGRGG